jgi:CPA2 family monovalent cation:H+ antiporter-2
MVLCVAAITTVIFQKIRQPVVVGYLLAGLIVGPHITIIPLLADSERIHTLSELGVILLMFALGLEFSVRKLLRLGPTSGFITALQVGFMLWLGYVCGRALGWTPLECIFTGAILSISSTTIVAKAYDETPVPARLRELAFGVLLAEDLTAVVELAVLTTLASGAAVSAPMMTITIARLILFLVAFVGIGFLVVPPLVRMVVKVNRPETTLVASVGICFGFALLAEHAGYSVALGAFLAGSLVAESGESAQIEHLVAPVRDIFGAVFFVSVGMMIDPQLIAQHWIALIVLTLAVIFGKIIGVTFASILSGVGTRTCGRWIGERRDPRISLHSRRRSLRDHHFPDPIHDSFIRAMRRFRRAPPPASAQGSGISLRLVVRADSTRRSARRKERVDRMAHRGPRRQRNSARRDSDHQ